MIIRALTTSILLSATCLTCLAQEPAADHPGGNSASVVTQGRPMPKFPAGLDGATINPKVPGAESDIACAPPMHGHDPRIMHMLERSGVVLSDDQVEQMTSLRRDLLRQSCQRKIMFCCWQEI